MPSGIVRGVLVPRIRYACHSFKNVVFFYLKRSIELLSKLIRDLFVSQKPMRSKYKFQDPDSYFVSFPVVHWMDLFIRKRHEYAHTRSGGILAPELGLFPGTSASISI